MEGGEEEGRKGEEEEGRKGDEEEVVLRVVGREMEGYKEGHGGAKVRSGSEHEAHAERRRRRECERESKSE